MVCWRLNKEPKLVACNWCCCCLLNVVLYFCIKIGDHPTCYKTVFCFCLSRIFMCCFYLSQDVIINVWAPVFIFFKVRLHIFTDYPTADLSFSNNCLRHLHFLDVKMTAFSATYSARHDFILRLRYDHFLGSGLKLLRICWKSLPLSVGQQLFPTVPRSLTSCFVFASISLNLGCRFCVFRIKHALYFLFASLFNFYNFHRRRFGGSKV